MIAGAEQVNADTLAAGERMGLELQCPQCHGWMGSLRETNLENGSAISCSRCRFSLHCEHGIWKALLPERETHFARFMADYQSIRAAEGRGSGSADYYLQLPYRDISGRNASQWAIRARTFRYIERRLLPLIAARMGRKLRILDLGAGNCWMSYRFALQGHTPAAVDLQTNGQDGLGAANHYRQKLVTLFPRFQAAVDQLPFTGGQFDLAIFNASFHYSEDYERTLAEAIRCTSTGGTILIADTPWYGDEDSGRKMVEERKAAFTARYGIASDGLASLEYLTHRRLRQLEDRFGIQWRIYTPYYGVRWSARPLLAKLRGQREPSRFRIYLAQVNA